jgi:hypothetical protein
MSRIEIEVLVLSATIAGLAPLVSAVYLMRLVRRCRLRRRRPPVSFMEVIRPEENSTCPRQGQNRRAEVAARRSLRRDRRCLRLAEHHTDGYPALLKHTQDRRCDTLGLPRWRRC